jgi:heterodisulfide reductase subunit A-like polyferredoxin
VISFDKFVPYLGAGQREVLIIGGGVAGLDATKTPAGDPVRPPYPAGRPS